MTLKLKFAALVASTLATTALAVGAEELPAALNALQKQGITIVGTFPSKTGLRAYAAMAGGQAAALYVTPNGAVIAGSALDAKGEELDAAVLEACWWESSARRAPARPRRC